MDEYCALNCRVFFRPIEANWHDAYLVSKWRNQDAARDAFFDTRVVTPDTHISFMQNRRLHDLVWIVEAHNAKPEVGMTGLIVDVITRIGEYGRTYVDHTWRGKGYAEDIEYTLLSFAFDFLNLNSLWLDALVSNVAIISLHKKLGWEDAGIHIHERGPVTHMVYSKEKWDQMFPYLSERAKERLCRSL